MEAAAAAAAARLTSGRRCKLASERASKTSFVALEQAFVASPIRSLASRFSFASQFSLFIWSKGTKTGSAKKIKMAALIQALKKKLTLEKPLGALLGRLLLTWRPPSGARSFSSASFRPRRFLYALKRLFVSAKVCSL